MNLSYMVRGADAKEYGPVTLEQLKLWVQEGRVSAGQELKRSDMGHWAAASNFSELQTAFPTATPAPAPGAPPPAAIPPETIAAVGSLKSGASWFYWIAGLSAINTIISFAGGGWRFIFGLGITQIFDQFGRKMGGSGPIAALMLDLGAAAVFVFCGVFAHKAQTWAFLVGMALFAGDALIFLLNQDWLGVGFHAFVLFCLFKGFSACRQLNEASARPPS